MDVWDRLVDEDEAFDVAGGFCQGDGLAGRGVASVHGTVFRRIEVREFTPLAHSSELKVDELIDGPQEHKDQGHHDGVLDNTCWIPDD